MTQQNFSNHGKTVPLFHYFVLPVFAFNFVWSLYRLKTLHFSPDGLVGAVVAAALVVAVLYARIFALAVQDRVIRLEERLRFATLLPDDLKPFIEEFTVAQLVSLRFASDAELPALARRVLDENVQNRRQIKQMVRNWRGDYLRA
jgi:hypothetical protein